MKIQLHDNETQELSVKRFYPPFEIIDNCPNCGREVVGCGPNGPYLSYPDINTATLVDFYCFDCRDDVEFEWSKNIIIRITAEAVLG